MSEKWNYAAIISSGGPGLHHVMYTHEPYLNCAVIVVRNDSETLEDFQDRVNSLVDFMSKVLE